MSSIAAVEEPYQKVKALLQAFHRVVPLNFITLHYIYYIATCLISAIIFWGSSTPSQSVSFTDSLFLTVSAMTQAGLNTVNLSQLNTWQQLILFFLILIGSSILISCAVVHTRKRAFESRFAHIIEEERRRRKALRSGISRPVLRPRLSLPGKSRRQQSGNLPPTHDVDGVVVRGSPIPPPAAPGSESCEKDERASHASEPTEVNNAKPESMLGAGSHSVDRPERLSLASELPQPGVSGETELEGEASYEEPDRHIHFVESPVNAVPSVRRRRYAPETPGQQSQFSQMQSPRTPVADGPRLGTERTDEFRSTSKYFHSDGLIGRNSQFHSLSVEERERLGGVEYRAVVLLEWIVILYFILWQLVGSLGVGAWIAYNGTAETSVNALNPWWVGIFLAVSAFNNNGMSLLDANMVAFQDSKYVLITLGLLILAGNTCYPVFLRLILWSLYQLLPDNSVFQGHRETLRFLLDHPRRCYTTLFPSSHTWWLAGSLILLNGIDWVAFEILNIDNYSIYTSPDAPKALDGLFQALAVRSGGFYVVPIANLRIGLLVLYVLMMYISVYPVTITLRNSNVYEERSLGIYADDDSASSEKTMPKLAAFLSNFRGQSYEGSRSYFIRQQLRGQLAHDLWLLCLAVLFITIIETQQFGRDPVTFAVFNILFEVVSGYGTVGISTGAPNVAFSFSGEWHILSKLILCAVMIRGRHRGLPVAIDRAVLLPGEHLGVAEEEDAALRRDATLDRATPRRRRYGTLELGERVGTT